MPKMSYISTMILVAFLGQITSSYLSVIEFCGETNISRFLTILEASNGLIFTLSHVAVRDGTQLAARLASHNVGVV
jgi:hypothetical protein